MKKIAPGIALVIASFVAIYLGTAQIDNFSSALFAPGSNEILWQIRIPRVTAALIVGASLALAGLMAQGACNNALAEPSILGTTAGASLGTVIAVLSGVVQVGSVGAIACGALGALGATALTFKLANLRSQLSSFALIIVGIAVSATITAIVGPNGSGKSTLLAAIAGDIAPSKGTITIDDVHPILTAPSQLARIRAVAIQSQTYTLGFTVQQVIEMAGPSQDVMQALDLTALANRQVTTLSGGEAQRVSIAAAIAQKTPVLLLDEPLAAQDIRSRKKIIELLQKLADGGVTVVVVAHSNESELTWADKVIKQFL